MRNFTQQKTSTQSIQLQPAKIMHVQEVAQEVAALQELTRKPPQEAKVLYFYGFNPQEH